MKDDEYVKAMKNQNDAIDTLIEHMRKQFIDMRQDFAEQLTLIEQSFNTERQKILKKNSDEIRQLFEEHKNLEDHFMRIRQQKEEEYTRELEKLRT